MLVCFAWKSAAKSNEKLVNQKYVLIFDVHKLIIGLKSEYFYVIKQFF